MGKWLEVAVVAMSSSKRIKYASTQKLVRCAGRQVGVVGRQRVEYASTRAGASGAVPKVRS